MILSILIPTLPERADVFNELKNSLNKMVDEIKFHNNKKRIEILSDDRPRGIKTGDKRNSLLQRASGEYTVFIDDDDIVPYYYLTEILKAIMLGNKPDVITFNGTMTTDGKNPVDWEIRLNHPYINSPRNGRDYYLRWPNHLCPMKKTLIKNFKFKSLTLGEDYEWSKRINDERVLKTEFFINKTMYIYKFVTK